MTNIIKGKFALAKLSNGVEILKAQANLLLVASSYSLLADAAIRRHYGQRAFPDNGVNSCSSFTDSMSVYGGWLKLCPPQWRCMGKVLHCGEIDSSRITRSHVDWQASVFQPVRNDILLYLASCWSTGFFTVFYFQAGESQNVAAQVVKTMQLVNVLWEPNALGGFNFQNPRAPTHVTQLLVTRLGLLASICQSTTRYQVMTRESRLKYFKSV